MKRALQIIFLISVIGVVFSGTLTYRELSGATTLVCPSPGAAGTLLGYPACVYGLVMYTLIALISGASLARSTKPAGV